MTWLWMARGVTIGVMAATLVVQAGYAHAESPDPSFGSRAHDQYVDVTAAKQPRRGGGIEVAVATGPRFLRRYAPACNGNAPEGLPSLDVLCPVATSVCADGDILYWVFVAPAGPPVPAAGEFRYANQTVCRGPGDVPADAIPVFGVDDFRRLPLPAGVVHIQPPNGRTLVNVPTNVYVDADTVTLPTQLLGFPVRVRATPARFHWRFGDGQTMTTRDGGAPYPDMTTTHVYTRAQQARVTLTTVYTGEYSVAGGPFQPIDGTATVTSPAAALTVVSAENRLTTG